jgi:hypothetical protein
MHKPNDTAHDGCTHIYTLQCRGTRAGKGGGMRKPTAVKGNKTAVGTQGKRGGINVSQTPTPFFRSVGTHTHTLGHSPTHQRL